MHSTSPRYGLLIGLLTLVLFSAAVVSLAAGGTSNPTPSGAVQRFDDGDGDERDGDGRRRAGR